MSDVVATPPPAPRGSWALLADRVFGPFFAGKVLSTVGVWMHNIAAAIVVYELTASATFVGAVSVAQFLPQFLLSPLSGAQADRGDRRRQLILGRLVAAGGSGGLALWTLRVALDGTTGALAVIVSSAVVGVGWALGGPAMHALIPSMVRRTELPAAVALNSVPPTLARAVGPALGAGVVVTLGATAAFALAAVGNLVFAGILAVLSFADDDRQGSADGSVRAGVHYLRANPPIGVLLLGAAVVGVGADPVVTLTPSVAARLQAGSDFAGVLASAFGVGAALAFVVLGATRRRLGLRRLGLAGLALMAVGLACLAVSPTPYTAMAAMAVAGSGMTFGLTSLTTEIQHYVAEDYRGRVMALWGMAFLGSRPFGAAVNGRVADLASVEVALLTVAMFVVGGAVFVGVRARGR